ncbi:MAG: tRNA lysidine(34) synthetase TilS [Candidatus Omnitrophica bacterium]|nr:tRNA lysidine(34) synthetase TilS [Candidatus Omnitrophota bacterium]
MTIIQKVKIFIKRNHLFQPGDRVLVGVSGGPDSVALLSILGQLKHELGIQIHAAHYNHQLRPTAMRDQKFVEELCSTLNVGYSSAKSTTLKNKKTGSIEEAARKERLDFLINTKKKLKFHSIALAHTKDDLAETILMRIIRGAGLQGLRAIQPLSEINGSKIIHPFLDLSKQEILKYLKQFNIPYKIDPTNQQLKFFRNKIRLNLIPLLEKEYNPNIKESLINLFSTMSTDYDFLLTQTNEIFPNLCRVNLKNQTISVNSEKLLKQPVSLRRMLFRQAYKTLKGDTNLLEQKHILAVERLLTEMPHDSIVDWPYGISISKTKSAILINRHE